MREQTQDLSNRMWQRSQGGPMKNQKCVWARMSAVVHHAMNQVIAACQPAAETGCCGVGQMKGIFVLRSWMVACCHCWKSYCCCVTSRALALGAVAQMAQQEALTS